MSDEKIKMLHDEYYDYEQKKRVGMYITLAGIVLLLAKFFSHISDSEYLIGIVIGGGGIYWGINFEKFSAVKKQLDQICNERYGKPYLESLVEIVDVVYKK